MNKYFLSILFFVLSFSFVHSQETLDENLVKALFVKRIVSYTAWENSELDTFTIAFLGDSEIRTYVTQLFEKDTKFSEKIKFISISDKKVHKPYNVLIVGENYNKRLKNIHPNTLSIMTRNGKNSEKVVLKFLVIDNSVHFTVNKRVLDKADFTLSSRVLKLSYSEESEVE